MVLKPVLNGLITVFRHSRAIFSLLGWFGKYFEKSGLGERLQGVILRYKATTCSTILVGTGPKQ